MREVSNRVLDLHFKDLARRGLPASAWIEDSAELALLKNKRERIDWPKYMELMTRGGRIWTSDHDLLQLGAAFPRSMAFRPLAAVARLLLSPRDFYRWGSQMGEGSAEGMFGSIRSEVEDLGPNTLQIRLAMKPGYAPCREFFVITCGSYTAMPSVLGLRDAKVTVTYGSADATYVIEYPQGGGTLAWLRRVLLWPFTARAAARELKDAHRDLQRRFQDLQAAQLSIESANARLARQATLLETANRIHRAIQTELDLDRRIALILSSLLATERFIAAELVLDAKVGGVEISRRLREGDAGGPPAIEQRLDGAESALGVLRLWPKGGADPDRDALLADLTPTIALALEQALTFNAVLEYRRTLEERVELRTRELVEASAARDRLFDNINHEIRTPLTITSLAIERVRHISIDELGLRDRPEGQELTRMLDAVARATQRLIRMTNDLLLLASSREAAIKLELRRADLAAEIVDLLHMWRVPATAKGLSLEYVGPPRFVATYDPSLVDDVVANLISNGIKYTSEGSIEISLGDGPSAGELEIVVRDTGPGIEPELRARLFGRFEQGAQRKGGTGLGLAIASAIVHAHHGRVSVDHDAGRGAIFRVVLPRGPSDGPIDAPLLQAAPLMIEAPSAPAAVRLTSADPNARHTILLAEDNAEVRAAIGSILSRRYHVLLAESGDRALALAEKYGADLLVTDLSMPGMDGFALTQRFRALPGNRLAPVVIVSAYGQLSQRMTGFDAGAVDFVVKPFEPAELEARVGSQLAMRDMALKLHEAEQVASTAILAAGVAHEVRNPANGIINVLGPLKQLLPPDLLATNPALAKLFEVLDLCAAQIREVSSHLLDLGRDRETAAKSARSTAALVKDALAISEPAIRSTGVRLDNACSADIDVECRASGLIQILVNLLENGAQAAGRGGELQIRDRVEAERWIVEVQDSGPGVPLELRQRIFDPFYTTKQQGDGSGLGLAISRRIALDHHAALFVSDTAGGACFRLEVPLSQRS